MKLNSIFYITADACSNHRILLTLTASNIIMKDTKVPNLAAVSMLFINAMAA